MERTPVDAAGDLASLEHELAERFPGRVRRRVVAVGALLLAIAAAVAATLAFLLGSRPAKGRARGSGVPSGETTATVRRRTLSEHATVDGTLTYSSALELYDRLSGTFTWLPAVGSVIRRGGTLFDVNERPIVLMYGSVPAYRTLKEGVSAGADVRELNENLVDLGYDPYGEIAEYERYGPATTAAVKRWQAADGLAQTGEVELGRVVFAPGARRITEVHVALGQDPPAASGAEPGTGESEAEEPAATEPAATEPTAEEPAAKEPAAKEPAAKEPAAKEPAAKERAAKERAPRKPSANKSGAKERAREEAASKAPAGGAADPAKSSPKGSSEGPASSGEPGSGGQAEAGAGMLVLTTTSTRQLVQLQVEAAEQQLAHVGELAPVTLPNGTRVRGRITKVGTVATAANGEGGEGGGATISVTIALRRPVRRLDEAPVTVELLEESVKDALTVPATALVATAGRRYAIETLRNGRRRQLEVTPGMFADGYVQIEGPGVRRGLTVIEPSE